MAFSKQELALMHDCINIVWQSGAVKSPQMAQGIEQLRAKVVEHMEPKAPEKEKGK